MQTLRGRSSRPILMVSESHEPPAAHGRVLMISATNQKRQQAHDRRDHVRHLG